MLRHALALALVLLAACASAKRECTWYGDRNISYEGTRAVVRQLTVRADAASLEAKCCSACKKEPLCTSFTVDFHIYYDAATSQYRGTCTLFSARASKVDWNGQCLATGTPCRHSYGFIVNV